jgi:hypothetical protein
MWSLLMKKCLPGQPELETTDRRDHLAGPPERVPAGLATGYPELWIFSVMSRTLRLASGRAR